MNRFMHYRYDRYGKLRRYRRGHTDWYPCTKGGMTVCIIEDDEGKMLGTGVARCAKVDNFNYAVGREISSARALRDFATLREQE